MREEIRVKENLVSQVVARVTAKHPQGKDASREMRTKFQGRAVPHYVGILPFPHLKTSISFLCKDSKSHYGINVFLFKCECWSKAYIRTLILRIIESHPYFTWLPINW